MFIQETKRLDLVLEGEEKKQPKKINRYKILSLILLIILFVVIFVVIIIDLKKDVKNCLYIVDKNTVSDEKKFEVIFTKLKEMEEKNSEYITSINNKINEIQNQNKDLKDLILLKDYEIKTQYKIINKLIFQNIENQNKTSEEQKDERENQNKD